MKKIICILFCCCIIISLSSCKNKNDNQNTTTAKATVITLNDVKSYAEKGEILGVDVKLGDTAPSIMNKYPTSVTHDKITEQDITDEDSVYLNIYEGNTLTSYNYSTQQYFIVNDKKEQGVAVIASAKSAYNFVANISSGDDIIYSLGKPDITDVPANDDLFYIFGVPQNVTRMTYLFGSNRLDFILADDILCMTVLTDTNVYTEMGDSVSTTEAVSAS